MSRFETMLPFTPGGDFYALRTMKLDGKGYVAGDKLDTSGIRLRTLRSLYLQRKVRIGPPTALEAAAAAASEGLSDVLAPGIAPAGYEPAPAADGAPSAPQPVAEGAPEAANPTPPTFGAFTLKHLGFGRYAVLGPDGAQVAGPFGSRGEAEAQAALMAAQ